MSCRDPTESLDLGSTEPQRLHIGAIGGRAAGAAMAVVVANARPCPRRQKSRVPLPLSLPCLLPPRPDPQLRWRLRQPSFAYALGVPTLRPRGPTSGDSEPKSFAAPLLQNCNIPAALICNMLAGGIMPPYPLASTGWLTSLTSLLPAGCRPCRQQDILAGQTPRCVPGSCYGDK